MMESGTLRLLENSPLNMYYSFFFYIVNTSFFFYYGYYNYFWKHFPSSLYVLNGLIRTKCYPLTEALTPECTTLRL